MLYRIHSAQTLDTSCNWTVALTKRMVKDLKIRTYHKHATSFLAILSQRNRQEDDMTIITQE